MQINIPLNNDWLYKNYFNEDDITHTNHNFKKVSLPHTNKEVAYNGFDERNFQFVSCYQKVIKGQREWQWKNIFLDFEGVMTYCDVYCNGQKLESHKGGYTGFSVDITSAFNYDGDNLIVLKVDSRERSDIPPFGNVVDYLTYGGIYREVTLRIADFTRIENVKLSSIIEDNIGLKIDLKLKNNSDDTLIKVEIADSNNIVYKNEFDYHGSIIINDLKDIKLWDIEHPNLYNIKITMESNGTKDVYENKFGFRKISYDAHNFYLNNKKIKLIGLNRHQSYPYVGYAMPKRMQEKDAMIIKQDLGCNVVRCSHYPQSKHFLNKCDEIGLMVLEEIPGWQHLGNEEWKSLCLKNVEDMINQHYNHPSIIMWGVRVNESVDDHNLYKATNDLAHQLDKTRPTNGVRYIPKSEFLEDIFTINDFVHDGTNEVFRTQKELTGLDVDVPLLITESNGHMFPTKRFDQEDRVVEHTLRHYRVMNEALIRDDLLGEISWCAFDYNTHGCFGSGDKICYHGVMDMYRNPKMASFSYSSQIDDVPFLEPLTVTSRGERNGGGIVPFLVATNVDYIKVYKNNCYVDTFYPQHDEYKGLKHPPIKVTHIMENDLDFGLNEDNGLYKKFLINKIVTKTLFNMSNEDLLFINDLSLKHNIDSDLLLNIGISSAGAWGAIENNLLIEGYINDKCVIEKKIGETKYLNDMIVKADDNVLIHNAPTYDVTRVVVSLVDNMDNVMPYINDCVSVEINGVGEIIGPKMLSFVGGYATFYVKTINEAGIIDLHIKSNYFESHYEILVK